MVTALEPDGTPAVQFPATLQLPVSVFQLSGVKGGLARKNRLVKVGPATLLTGRTLRDPGHNHWGGTVTDCTAGVLPFCVGTPVSIPWPKLPPANDNPAINAITATKRHFAEFSCDRRVVLRKSMGVAAQPQRRA